MRRRVRSTLVAVALSTAVAPVSQAVSASAVMAQAFQDRAPKRCLSVRNLREVITIAGENGYSVWMPRANGSYRLIQNLTTGQCSDSNTNKYIYTNRCNKNSKYQNWEIMRSGGYILFRNRATGLCPDGNASGRVYVDPRRTGNSFQNWR
jgi:hypothetical protein